ncbi:MAG: hypothetical protein DRJ40_01670 [Thermoprotei archaeon]|nr:MAG: hypothetical protein DRJ40_01670 [Thermoprotei archaeon]
MVSIPENPDMCYVLGVLLGDGYVNFRLKRVELLITCLKVAEYYMTIVRKYVAARTVMYHYPLDQVENLVRNLCTVL